MSEDCKTEKYSHRSCFSHSFTCFNDYKLHILHWVTYIHANKSYFDKSKQLKKADVKNVTKRVKLFL